MFSAAKEFPETFARRLIQTLGLPIPPGSLTLEDVEIPSGRFRLEELQTPTTSSTPKAKSTPGTVIFSEWQAYYQQFEHAIEKLPLSTSDKIIENKFLEPFGRYITDRKPAIELKCTAVRTTEKGIVAERRTSAPGDFGFQFQSQDMLGLLERM